MQRKIYHGKWSYDIGVVLQGVKEAYEQTGDKRYLDYIQTRWMFILTKTVVSKTIRWVR